MSHLRRKSGGTKVFLVSGVTEDVRKELARKINQLGGKYFELKYFKAVCTHVICGKLSKSEKFLGGCACGKWVLHPDYIYQSVIAGTWLDEEQFEWCDDHIRKRYSGIELELFFSPRRWRFMLEEGRGAFCGWKVAVVAGAKKSQAIKRLLISGGAEVFNLKLPVKNPNKVADTLGYIFVSEQNIDLVAHLFQYGVLCIKPDFIGDFLLRDPPPDPMEYVVEQTPIVVEDQGSEGASSQNSFLMESQANLSEFTDFPVTPTRIDNATDWIQNDLGEESLTQPRRSHRTQARPSTPVWQQLIPHTRVKREESIDSTTEIDNNSDNATDLIQNMLDEESVTQQRRSQRSQGRPSTPVWQKLIPQTRIKREESPDDKTKNDKVPETNAVNGVKDRTGRVPPLVQYSETGGSPGSAIVIDDFPDNTGELQGHFINISESPTVPTRHITSTRSSTAGLFEDKGQERGQRSGIRHVVDETQMNKEMEVVKTIVKTEPNSENEPGMGSDISIKETACVKLEKAKELPDRISSTPAKIPAIKTIKSERNLFASMSPITAFFKPIARTRDTTDQRNTPSINDSKATSMQPVARKSLLVLSNKKDTPPKAAAVLKKAHSVGAEQPTSLGDENMDKSMLDIETGISVLAPESTRKLPPRRGRGKTRVSSAPVSIFAEKSNNEKVTPVEADPSTSHQITAAGDEQSTNERQLERMEVDSLTPSGDDMQNKALVTDFERASCSRKRKSDHSPDQFVKEQKRQRVSLSEWRPVDFAVHYREKEDPEERQCLSSVQTEIFQSIIEEEEFTMLALQELNARISYKFYPPSNTIASLIHRVLPEAKSDLQASLSHKLLMKILRLHPPVTIEMQQVYLQALAGPQEEKGVDQEWKTIQTCIRIMLFEDDKDVRRNHFLLFNFIQELLQQNLQHFVLSETAETKAKHMWLRILWCPSYHIVFNSRCRELLDLLQRTIDLYRTQTREEDKTRLLDLLQNIVWLVSMAAECCRLEEAKVVKGIQSLQLEKVSAFAFEISRRLIDRTDPDQMAPAGAIWSGSTLYAKMPKDAKIQDKMLLEGIWSAMQMPWLCVGVCQRLLNELDDRLLPNDTVLDVTEISFSVIVNKYFFLLPRLNKRTNSGDKVSAVTKNRTSVERRNSDTPSKCLVDNGDVNLNGKNKCLKNATRKNAKGETQLHRACISGNIAKVKQLLQVPGIDVNAQDNCGWTPLHEACNHGHVECVRELLKFVPSKSVIQYLNKENKVSKIDLLAKNEDGITPLFDAVNCGQLEVIRLLLQHGGSKLLSAVTNSGLTPLQIAKTDELHNLLSSFEPVQRKVSESQDSLIGSQDSFMSQEEMRTELPSNSLYEEVLSLNSSRIYAESGAITNYINLITALFYNYILATGINIIADKHVRLGSGSFVQTSEHEQETVQGRQLTQSDERSTDFDGRSDFPYTVTDKENIPSTSSKSRNTDSPRNRSMANVLMNRDLLRSPHRQLEGFDSLDRHHKAVMKKDLKVLKYIDRYYSMFKNHLFKLCHPEDKDSLELELMDLNFIIQHHQYQELVVH